MNPPSNPQPLQLVPAPPSGRPVTALFLSGGGPADWLEEICAWDLGSVQAELKLYVLPRAVGDRAPGGVLAVLPGGCPTPATARARPYSMLIGRLYLPVDACLEPSVSDEELRRLCGQENVFVFHPGVGLCAFEAADALALADLLAAPATATQDWGAAHPGLTPNARLRSVRLEMPSDLEALFGDAAREIGADAGDPGAMPPVPGEAAAGPAAEANRKLQEWLARMALALTGALPRTASAPNWLNRLENWANGHLTQLTAELSELRHRELHRLLHLLDENPDAGLRRAIPLAGLFQRRGRAQPTGRLGQRDPNFRLGALTGGKAADAWAVPPDLQSRLRERYRQLANEEARLGRHRRAAYIHAELLGDLPSAAACLKQGQHYHEAAVLYRDHLRRPLEAADCLAAGGEWAEAIALYEKERRFLQAAKLYAAVGDEAAAAAAYRREVDLLTAADDLLTAADLLEKNLSAPDEAVALLRAGWPGSKQAGRCLERAFELLGAHGAHPQAAELVAGLAAETPLPTHILSLTRQLAAAQETYPDEGLRHAARDLARVRVAGRLPDADLPEMRGLLDALYRLAPADRLLIRDGNRYLAERQEQEKRRAAAPPKGKTASSPSSRRTPRQGGSIQLSRGTRWRQVRSVGNSFFAAGYNAAHRQVELVRSGWDGSSPTELAWRGISPGDVGNRPMLLEAPRGGSGTVVLAFIDDRHFTSPSLAPRRFPPAEGAWGHSLEGGQPTWWPGSVSAATFAADGNLWLLRAVANEGVAAHVEMLLSCYSGDGVNIGSQTLPESVATVLWSAEWPMHLSSVGNFLLVACLDELFIYHAAARRTELKFDAPIIGLVPTTPLARAGCAVRLQNGVALVWLDQLSAVQTVVTNVRAPLAAFTRLGSLVVLPREEKEGQLFEIIRGEARAAADFAAPAGKPITMVRTAEREGFAVFSEEGTAQLYTG